MLSAMTYLGDFSGVLDSNGRTKPYSFGEKIADIKSKIVCGLLDIDFGNGDFMMDQIFVDINGIVLSDRPDICTAVFIISDK
jgi:hypothetical protein